MTELPEVHTSERSTLKRCAQRWWWQYEMGLQQKGDQPDALWFGIGVHIALARWYGKGKKRGPHPADTFEDWCGEEERQIRASREDWQDEGNFISAREMGVYMLEGYVDHYGRDERWNVISTEQEFKVTVKSNGIPVAVFASTWDGVYRDEADGEIWLMEHKTASQVQLAYLALDDQAGSYWAVASTILRAKGILKKDEKIAGIMYNFLRKAVIDDRPQDEAGNYLNKDGSVSKRQPARRFIREPVERSPSENKTQMQRLADEVRIMNGMRDGSIPITKSTTKDCTFCPFFIMCQLHERGGDNWKRLAKADFIKSDPYNRDHHKSAAA